MIQGSNAPIILNMDTAGINKVYARLFMRNETLKEWDENSVLMSDGKIILPLLESETINFPKGSGHLEVKWVDGATVKFSNIIEVLVEARQDKRTFNVGEGDAPTITENITPDENQEIIIVKQYIGGNIAHNGETWYPNVDADGTLTWTKSASSVAPAPINIKGAKGADGYTPVKGVDYFDGAKGDAGERGADGLPGAKGDTGPKGDKGDTGAQGPKGDTGADGANGANGADGYTPVRGTDYWTAADINTIKSYVDNAILNGSW